MNPTCSIELLPLGRTLAAPVGTSLRELLFAEGVEFPCGGRGRCRGCRVKVLDGDLGVTGEDRRRFSAAELEEGWRLACQARATRDLRIELAQWEASILADHAPAEFTPRAGLGIAIDLGTTTIVAQLLDLNTGNVLCVRTALNAQARYGADVMSRIDFARSDDGRETLTSLVRMQIGELVCDLMSSGCFVSDLRGIVLVGNTVMHHLFSGISVEPLSHHPFTPVELGVQVFTSDELGWELADNAEVRFLPCLGGFVGSDILAGAMATRLHDRDRIVGLVDLGTNGEIMFGNRERMLCASTAAGPAFEGARISMGMRAATGAISRVSVCQGELVADVLGNVEARGLCGSGLVDAVACALDLGLVDPGGRLPNGGPVPLGGGVSLSQQDIRELQLAKGAIAAGIRLLLEELGAAPVDVERVYLAGAFGNYVNRASAKRIGLLDFGPEVVEPSGNTALLGAKLALFNPGESDRLAREWHRSIEHVSLNESERFHEVFVSEMAFPDR